MQITDYHGTVYNVKPGQVVVNEYYKGFLNRVYPFWSRVAAETKRDSLRLSESYMMDSPKHFNIQTIKE